MLNLIIEETIITEEELAHFKKIEAEYYLLKQQMVDRMHKLPNLDEETIHLEKIISSITR